ncbi:DUF4388 domain-containing protein [Anaeromyxobacter oryzisoli]|uniref:DUF4388 domain-containing protein n=1 Tax=Anaeromyxobacter oryzisoli TaxID=2925408 RepID=UPI001F561A20|nr:DUF4388 domain-containing protein [Anaeromyxobacter sp. SG63]
MRGLMGSFAVLPLADVVELLVRRRLSGTLTCERGSIRKTLHLDQGDAVAAASNDPREFLGQLLVDFGHLTEEQLAKAFRTQEETRVRLGKVLTMTGLVPATTVRDVLAIKIRETLLDAFLWDAGVFSFDDGPPPAPDDTDPRVPLADIAREAEFRATAWSAFRAQFPTGGAPLEVDEAKVPAGLAPSTIDGRLLALARDGKTIDEVGLALRATDFQLYQRLYALARQGVVRAAPPPVGAVVPADAVAPELLDRARELLAAGRPEDAERVAARAVELAPGAESARALLAATERALGEHLRAELLAPPRTPRLRLAADELERLRLPATDRYLLARCDGRRTVEELTRFVPLRELELLKAIRRFVSAGWIALG